MQKLKKRAKDRLSGLDRDVLAAVRSTAGTIVKTPELAQLVHAPLRSVERSLSYLRSLGLLETERKGRLPALRSLTPRGLSVDIGDPLGLTGRTEPTGRAEEEGRGFIGDADALDTALLVSHFQKRQSPVDLAREYLDRASGSELKRLALLQDENGLFEEWATLTGHAALDDGLRTKALNEYRRERARAQILGSLRPLSGS